MYKKSLTITVILLSCFALYIKWWTKGNYLPKPFGYVYIDLPEHKYQQVTRDDLPYKLEISQYAILEKPDNYKEGWIDISYPSLDPEFKATIQITYKYINGDNKKLSDLLEDSFKIGYKHHIRATSIDQNIITTTKGLQIMLVTITGEVPTSFQFYTLNSTKHFLRGALYFPTALENEYLEPIIEYIKTDIKHMLEFLEWK